MSKQEEEIHSPEIEAKKPPKNYIPEKLLHSWTPHFTWRSSVALYLTIGFLSFAYGIFITWANTTVTELKVRYDDICKDHKECLVSVTVPERMEAPVFVYYGLENFYQNHRLYLVSRSIHQLEGEKVDLHHLEKECPNATYNWQMGIDEKFKNPWGKTLNTSHIAVPCGLIAKAFFNDEFKLFSPFKGIDIDSTDIVWPKTKFKNHEDHEESQWISMEEEHFQVWMKTGVFADGRKLWGRIREPLEAGDYFMKIQNRYDVKKFNGAKYFVLTTSNVFGGKVEFLAATFLVIGMVFLMISLCFFNRSKETKKVNFSVRGVTN